MAASPSFVLRGHASEVMAARFASGAAWHDATSGLPHLLTGAADGELRIWSLQTCRPLASVRAHSDASILTVQSLSQSRVLSQGRDRCVRIWDVGESGIRGPLLTLPVGSYNFCQCAISAALATRPLALDEGSSENNSGSIGGAPLFALPSDDAQQLQVRDMRQPPTVPAAAILSPAESEGKAGMCMCARFALDDSRVLSGWENGALHAFDLRRGGAAATSSAASRKLHSEPLLTMDLGPNDEHAITGAADCALQIVPLAEGAPCAPEATLTIPITNEHSGSGGIAALTMRPDGKVFAAGGWDRRVRLWQWRKFKPLAVLQQHTGTVNAVSFSDDSKWLASGSSDCTVALWQLFPPQAKCK